MTQIRTVQRLALATTAIVATAVAFAPPAAAAVGVDPSTIQLSLGPGEGATLAVRVTTPQVGPRPDIVFLADTTGSMLPVLSSVRNNAFTIMDRIRQSQPNARFGVVDYKEQRNGDQVFRIHTPLTDESDMVQAGMQNWIYTAGGGGDPHTDFINAFHRIGTDPDGNGNVGFRPNGTRIIAWFGDARSHDPSLGHTLADAQNALRQAGIQVVAVPVSGTPGGGLDALGQATSITNAARGILMPEMSGDRVAQALLDGIENLTVTVTPQITSCANALSISFDTASRTVPSGTDANVNMTVQVQPDAANGAHLCSVDYLVNGISQGFVQNITVTVGPDTTPPQITAAVSPATPNGANGWYVSAPTVSFNCTDASGIANCTPPVTLGSSSQPQTVTGSAVDTLGNTASTSVTGLKVDLVDPAVICGPTPTFVIGAPGQVTATVTDVHSGPAAPSAAATADTTGAGTRAVIITGADLAGRTGSAACPYQVGRVPSSLFAHPATLGIRPLLQVTLTPRATLTRIDTGVPLAGQQIVFTSGNQHVCTALTNTAGVASCTGPVNVLAALLGGYTASFAGSTAIDPATAQGRLG